MYISSSTLKELLEDIENQIEVEKQNLRNGAQQGAAYHNSCRQGMDLGALEAYEFCKELIKHYMVNKT